MSEPATRRPRVPVAGAGRAARVASAAAALVLPSAAVATSAEAAASESTAPAAVRVLGSVAPVLADGSVRVRIGARCPSTYQPYELQVGVRQGEAFGSVGRIAPPPVVVCDGTPHVATVLVAPESGTFTRGRAQVDVFLGLFDTVSSADADLETSRTVWLRACRTSAA